MGQLSAKLRSAARGGLTHWCPACAEPHTVWVGQGDGPRWRFDGNLERPTFDPSVKIVGGAWGAYRVCHYFIRAGLIEFCGDSSHAMAGHKDVPLPDLPLHMRDGAVVLIGARPAF